MSNKTKVGLEMGEKCVWLQVEDLTECCFEIWDSTDGTTSSLVKVKVPIESWKKIIEKWNLNKDKEK
jgi:hypothetical protein